MTRYTKEGKVAEKIANSLNDITLNLELVGTHLADLTSSVQYNRFYEVFESARQQKEYKYSEAYRDKIAKVNLD